MRARLTDKESMAAQWGYPRGGGSADKTMLRLSNRQASGVQVEAEGRAMTLTAQPGCHPHRGGVRS